MLDSNAEEELYKVYITDCLSNLVGANRRFYDIVYPNSYKKEEEKEKTGDEIAADIISRYGLKFAEEGRQKGSDLK